MPPRRIPPFALRGSYTHDGQGAYWYLMTSRCMRAAGRDWPSAGGNRRPISFRKPHVPSREKLEEMKKWAQGGAQWGPWREENNTVGASAIGGLFDESEYYTPGDAMEMFRGSIDISRAMTRKGSAYTKLGHLFEPLNRLATLRILNEHFVEGGGRGFPDPAVLDSEEMGVLFDRNNFWKTASIDGSFTGTAVLDLPRAGRVPANLLLNECKSPSRKIPWAISGEYMAQIHQQLDVCKSQPYPDLSRKTGTIFSVLQLPTKDLTDVEGRERVVFGGDRVWILKLWYVPWSKEYHEWSKIRMGAFIEAYEKGARDFGYIEEARPPVVEGVVFLGDFGLFRLDRDLELDLTRSEECDAGAEVMCDFVRGLPEEFKLCGDIEVTVVQPHIPIKS